MKCRILQFSGHGRRGRNGFAEYILVDDRPAVSHLTQPHCVGLEAGAPV